jgi:hypothetical protein
VRIQWDGSGESTLGLPDLRTIWKSDPDGGDLLYSYLLGSGLIQPDLLVTMAGVNVSHCVYKTACGLAARLSDEHGLTDQVTIDLSLCGDSDQFRVRFRL